MPSEARMVANYGIDLASGNPNANKNLAKSAVGYGIKETLAEPLVDAFGAPLAGGVVGLGTALAGEMFEENPNYEKAAVGSVGSTVGAMAGAALGPIGSFLGSMVGRAIASEQYANGAYGDARDVRSWEEVRDFYEDEYANPMSRSQTKALAAGITDGVKTDIKQFDHMEKKKSLGADISNDYGGGLGEGGHNVGGERGSSTGTGGGYNDGHGGVSGL